MDGTAAASPVHVIASEAATQSAHRGFGYFSFALVGLPLVAAVIAISVWLGPRLVPKRGLCMMAVFFVAATLLVPVIWPF